MAPQYDDRQGQNQSTRIPTPRTVIVGKSSPVPAQETSLPDPGASAAARAFDPEFGLNEKEKREAREKTAAIVSKIKEKFSAGEDALKEYLKDHAWKNEMRTAGAEWNKIRVQSGRQPTIITDAEFNAAREEEWQRIKRVAIDRAVARPSALRPDATPEERQAHEMVLSERAAVIEEDAAKLSWAELQQKYAAIDAQRELERATLFLVQQRMLAENHNEIGIAFFRGGFGGQVERAFQEGARLGWGIWRTPGAGWGYRGYYGYYGYMGRFWF